MGKNKAHKKTSKSKGKNGIARGFNALLSGRFLTREYVQRNLQFIFFLVGIMICYIGYGYFSESNMKSLMSARDKKQKVKAQNLSVHSRLEQLKQQSHVARSIRDLGLLESTEPPSVIRVGKDVMEEIEGGEK